MRSVRNLIIKDGLSLVFSSDIDKKTVRTPFSYVSPRKVEIEIINRDQNNKIIFFSFKQDGCKLKEREISNYVIGIADPSFWKIEQTKIGNTDFSLITKKTSQIPIPHWKTSMNQIWENYTSLFGEASDHITFIELNWAPVSGDPLEENVLALFYQNKIPPEFQKELLHDLGWTPHDSTMNYVLTYYRETKNPWPDYLFGTYAHELAHLYFGFGQTRERVTRPHELWFSLGMGLIYDTEVTQKFTGHYPALFSDSDKILKQFEQNPEIDQRLINPNNDKKHNLDRKKVYAHSKALQFLQALKQKLGDDLFNKITKRYLNECKSCVKGYEDFKKFIPNERRKDIAEVEKKFRIY